MLWLLASEDINPLSGCIRLSDLKIAFRLRISTESVTKSLQEIDAAGFILIKQSCIESVHKELRNGYKSVPPETETETETETEKQQQREMSKSEIIFKNCFDQYEDRLQELYPHADYQAEKETCIAHYSKQAVLDPYPVILKWFNRVPKPVQKEPPKTFEQIKMDNTKKVMVDFIKRGQTDAASGQGTIHSDIRGAFRSIPCGSDTRDDGNVLEISPR